jgi:uncharacterized protein YwgA
MNENIVALKVVLDALGESSDISSLDDRKRIQKAIYLGQRTGVDLGYRFGWYIRGPYSTSLARDYYQLADELQVRERDFEGKKLRSDAATKLQALAPLFQPPPNFKLDKEDWLELLASWDYLRTVSRQDAEKARATIHEEKPRLAPYIDEAAAALKRYKLLPA